MRPWKFLAFPALIVALLNISNSEPAQVSVNIGAARFARMATSTTPRTNCAPYGYYGPEWFTGGVLIGVGPWFHGPHDFHGNVDNRFDPHHGYGRSFPERGDKAFNHFRGKRDA